VIAAEVVVESITNEVAVVAESHVLEHQVPPPNLPVAFRDRGDDEPLRADPCLVADGLGASRMVSWAALVLFVQEWM